MALSAADLSSRIRLAVEASTGNEMPDIAILVWEAVSAAITAWLQETATVPVIVTSVTGVTLGINTSGPGTGTGTIV